MTAREQAREAGALLCKYPGNFTISEIADRASDIWEPIIKEIYRLSDVPLNNSAAWILALTQIEALAAEALGE